MRRTFLEGDQLEVTGLDGLAEAVPPETADSVLVDSVGRERELTRVTVTTAHALAHQYGVELGDPVELANGALATVGHPMGDPARGAGVLITHPAQPDQGIVTSLGPGADLDMFVRDLASMRLDAAGSRLVVRGTGRLRPVARRAPRVVQVVPRLGLFQSERIRPGTARPRIPASARGLRVAGGRLYRKEHRGVPFLLLDGGATLTRLFPHPQLRNVDEALDAAARLVVAPA